MSSSYDIFNGLDVFTLVLYFISVLAVGIWCSFQSDRSTVRGYFLAGSKMVWMPVGISLFVSNVGCGHFIGLAGMGATGGIAVGAFELNGMFVLFLLGWVFLPVYLSAQVYTTPEYLRKRFGGQRIRVYFACFTLVTSVLTKISVEMYAGALFIQQTLGWNLYISTVALLLLTAVYTITGGLSAVIYTDVLHCFFLLIGGFTLMILSLQAVPWGELPLFYACAIPTSTILDPNATCGYPREDAFKMYRDPSNADIPWPGSIFGVTVSAIWYWCTDQVTVQRTLASKNILHAQGACILAGFLKSLPIFMLVIPGMVSRVLFPDEVACVTAEVCAQVCGNPSGCSNFAYTKLVVEVVPEGLRGLVIAGVLSSLMSSLTSIFNSCSAVFTLDIWRRIRPNVSEVELMIVGRVTVLMIVGMSLLWIPVIQVSQGGRLFDYIQFVTSYLSPPVTAVMVLAVTWHRTTEKGAFIGLMVGLVIGLVGFIIEIIFHIPTCYHGDQRPEFFKRWHYLYFGLFLFVFVIILSVAISLCTEPLDTKMIDGLTWWTTHKKTRHNTSMSRYE
ncbi:sodium/glucose cotransporter 4-like isoform X2 [Apostichopus japonicus]|uniref:sodium/glucose cotransporter 4-like isoform X2 n=1 Tax=Stichopus japonicus TaxID=307972 RepID=UPI003AB14668